MRLAIALPLCCALLIGCRGKTPVTTRPPFSLPVAGEPTNMRLKIGDQFPDIQGVDLDGQPMAIDRQRLQGKHTLIIFWSKWCGFCMQELPHEVELASEYESYGLQVIGVNADQSPEIAQAAAAEHNVPWPNLYEGANRQVSTQLGINSWPTLLLLDTEGRVISGTNSLRLIGIEDTPEGPQRVDSLDWTLREVLKYGGK